MHPFISVLSPSFLYHPYIPSFKSKDFSFTCLLSFFFAAHCTLRNNIIIIAWGYLLLFTRVYVVLSELCYVCTPTFMLQLLIWASYRHFYSFEEKLPEAICCCLQTCNVDVVLYCMYIQDFIVTIVLI